MRTEGDPICSLWTDPPMEIVLDFEDGAERRLGVELILFDVAKNGRNLTDH